MSKSLGNYIGITERASEIFGKIMSISDKLMLRYYELLTDFSLDEIKTMHPKEAKKKLARTLVAKFYDEKEAAAADQEFEAIFAKGELPQDIPLRVLKQKKMNIIDLLVETGLLASKSEARRVIQQKGVKIDDQIVTDEKQIVSLELEQVLKVGKRKFIRVKAAK